LKRIKNIIIMLFFCTPFILAQNSAAVKPNSTTATKDSSVVKQDSTRFDGHTWKKTNPVMLIPFLTGVFDGLSLGSDLVLSSFPQNNICAQTGTQNIEDFYKRIETLQVGDLYQSINSFYRDSLNINVIFDNAFIIGVYKASKADQKTIDKLTMIYRKEDNDEKK
jgi:hypothetical protein